MTPFRIWGAHPRRALAPIAMLASLLVAGWLAPSGAAAATDTDRDGLPDSWERQWSLTDPSRADSDGNGRLDGSEDPDRDKLTNRQEYLAGMNPQMADSDKDGVRDDSEDTDGDGLPTAFEFRAGTSPKRTDSDGDGRRDGSENPDRDGLSNRQEYLAGMHPRRADTDRDGIRDEQEDTDHDGLRTWFEFRAGASPQRDDSDGDGLRDGSEDPDTDTLTNRQEYLSRMHPQRADTDKDGLRDAREDTDRDSLRTGFEFLAGTSPRRADTDSDGRSDRSEDPDRDGLSNGAEQKLGTQPRNADTDDDGWTDGAEFRAGTSPRNAESHPSSAPLPAGKSVTVASIAALKTALADDSVDEIIVANGTYHVSPSNQTNADSLWIGGNAYAARTRPITVRAATIGGVTFDGGGASGYGGLSFEDGAHHQTWDGFNFANMTANQSGIIEFGGYLPRRTVHHLTVRNIRILGTCRGRATTASGNTTEHAIYFAHAAGVGPHDLLAEDISVDGSGFLASAIHGDHGDATNPPAYNVTVRRLHVTKTQQAIILWQPAFKNWTIDGADISGALAYAIRYEAIGGTGITFANITSTGSGVRGFYSSLGTAPPNVTFINGSIH